MAFPRVLMAFPRVLMAFPRVLMAFPKVLMAFPRVILLCGHTHALVAYQWQHRRALVMPYHTLMLMPTNQAHTRLTMPPLIVFLYVSKGQ